MLPGTYQVLPRTGTRATKARRQSYGQHRSKIRPAVFPSRRLSALSRTSAHTAEGGQVALGWPHLKSHHIPLLNTTSHSLKVA